MTHLRKLTASRKNKIIGASMLCICIVLGILISIAVSHEKQARKEAIAEAQVQFQLATRYLDEAQNAVQYAMNAESEAYAKLQTVLNIVAQAVAEAQNATEIAEDAQAQADTSAEKAKEAQTQAEDAPDQEAKEEAIAQAQISIKVANEAQTNAQTAIKAAEEATIKANTAVNNANEIKTAYELAKKQLYEAYQELNSTVRVQEKALYVASEVAEVKISSKARSKVSLASNYANETKESADIVIQIATEAQRIFNDVIEKADILEASAKDIPDTLSQVHVYSDATSKAVSEVYTAILATSNAVTEAEVREEVELEVMQLAEISYYQAINSGNVLTPSGGVCYYNGHKETYYSELVLPGGGLNIPGRHTDSSGLVRDGDGYICVAADYSYLPYGSIVETSLGLGKVYDTGCAYGVIDIYTNW